MEENRSAKSFLDAYEWLESLTHAAVVVVLLFLFVFRTSIVSGISMEKTLQGGKFIGNLICQMHLAAGVDPQNQLVSGDRMGEAVI